MNNENKYTHEDLVAMQALPLNRKILIAQTRIIEWYQKLDGQEYLDSIKEVVK